MRRVCLVGVTLSAAALGLVLLAGCPTPRNPAAGAGQEAGYLFCFWNVENLFDDKDDDRHTKGDSTYDRWFARDPAARQAKLAHLCDVLIPLNDGRGPDILGVAEVESERAAELLKDALNARLGNPDLAYQHVLFKNPAGGRHIATALLTRLPVVRSATELWGRRLRILETRVRVNQQELTVVVSHWTSRVSDHKGTGRAKYGDVIQGEYRRMWQSARQDGRDVDVLVCGDFNDNPDDPSVTEHLRATGDLEKVKTGGEPLLFNLFARPYQQGEASHYYGRNAYQFDQVCVSPGMLDNQGWWCDVDSAQVVKQMADARGRPNRFGSPNDRRPLSARGASDHFPVTVRLHVQP